jgi:hypothetical protein
MTANNTDSPAIVEISSQTEEVVETTLAGETDEVKLETKALIESIRRRAQAEAQAAGTLTRETYLKAVRRARETVEGNKLIERDNLEHSWAVFQEEFDKNWHLLLKEAVDLGVRLQDAAKAAWEAFHSPRH